MIKYYSSATSVSLKVPFGIENKNNDSITLQPDYILELSRLILEGKNIRFEELPCEDRKRMFDTLSQNWQIKTTRSVWKIEGRGRGTRYVIE